MELTNAQRAYPLIKERIVTTAMRPGARVEEAALMAELGLGRTPIREALQRLAQEKLVVVSPHRGTFVADLSLTDLREVEEVRLELECLCARLAVQRMTPGEVENMRRVVAEMQAFTPGGNLAAGERTADLLALDRRLHALLRQGAHNELLAAKCEMLFNLSLRLWYLFAEQTKPQNLVEESFVEILAGIESGDAARAGTAMRKHILHYRKSIPLVLYNHAFFGGNDTVPLHTLRSLGRSILP
jgi:DNA-binding GntR family transcriptional regulator